MARKIGFEKAIVAILDDDTEHVVADADKGLSADGLFTIDAKSALGVLTAAITGLEPTATKIYGSDQVVDVSQKGSGSVQATLGVNDLPDEILYKLAGMTQDEVSGGWIQDSSTKPPKAALLLMSHNTKGQPIYLALYKGTFGPEEVTLNSNTETAQLATDSIVFHGLNRLADKRIFGKYTVDPALKAKDEATVLKDVFLGYTPAP